MSLLVTAYLDSPLAGDPPQLDALLEWSLSPFEEEFQEKQRQGLPHSRVDRNFPAPPQAVIRIPIKRTLLGGWHVAECSNPILPIAKDSVEYVCKRISPEHVAAMVENHRIVNTTNSWTKSYRLPMRVRTVHCVRWFCNGNQRNLQKALRDVYAIGKKVADGYGRVRKWEIVGNAPLSWWYAPHASGIVLMRTLPYGSWLPDNLLGARQHFGACVPPYWHPERFGPIVVPA